METGMIFLSVLLADFFAEMGDKTQLMLIGLSSKYKIRHIMAGTLAAIVVLNAAAVFLGSVLNEFLASYLWAVKFVAAAAFLYFAVTSLRKDEDEEEDSEKSRFSFAPLAVFCTFFVAELGDKTQLAALTFGATYGMANIVVVLAACVVGFFAADMIGMLAGLILKKNVSGRFLAVFSFVLFVSFAAYTAYEGVRLFLSRT
ncbi:MAG: TMEM165/GDT1 family protein [Treponema sp.]|nr:TMEM165/GDT1 family protein [Treponema sp.]